jgi:hypothetical protein
MRAALRQTLAGFGKVVFEETELVLLPYFVKGRRWNKIAC